MIGNDLDSCLHALTESDGDSLHLLERINFSLQVQNSIVPTAYNLARFKASMHLPSLKANLSDTKYKSLMRLVDVAVPHFDTADAPDSESIRPSIVRRGSGTFRLSSGIFGAAEEEYNLVEDDEDNTPPPTLAQKSGESQYFDAEDGSSASTLR